MGSCVSDLALPRKRIMDLSTYNTITKSENSARKYLLKLCWKNYRRFCPRCRNRKVYVLDDGRRRCPRCGYTFHDFSRRFLNGSGLSGLEWLWFLKLFELDTAPDAYAEQLGVADSTARKALRIVRAAVLAHSLDARLIFQVGLGSMLGTARAKRIKKPGRGGPRQPLVFGLLEQGDMVFADLLPELGTANILHFKRNFRMQTRTAGPVVYTDRFRQYESLVVYDPELLFISDAPHDGEDLHVDRTKGFWLYAKPRFMGLRNLTPRTFPLVLKEMEFRWNNRNGDIFQATAEYICDFVPNLK